DLLYDPHLERCEWPGTVECGDRIIPDKSDDLNFCITIEPNDVNNNTNTSPSEVKAICARGNSEGTFIPHENCNQFYTCSNAIPVTLTCPSTLLYNLLTEKCDWP
ncbi:chitin binding domain-containing protein, partial [Chitinophaga agrisoli]